MAQHPRGMHWNRDSRASGRASTNAWHVLAGTRWLVLAVLFLARTAVAFQFQSIAAVGPGLVRELGIDYTALGTLVGLYMLPGVALAVPGGLLGQRFGDKPVAIAGGVLMIVGGALAAAGYSPQLLGAGRVASGAGAVLLNILLAKMATDWFGKREIVLAMAVLVTSWPLGIGLALLIVPHVAALLSIEGSMWATTGACACATALLLAYRAPATLPGASSAPKAALSAREWALSLLAGSVWALFNVAFAIVPVFGPAFVASRGVAPASAAATISVLTWVTIASIPLGGWLGQRVSARNVLMCACFGLMLLVLLGMAQVLAPAAACIAFGVFAGPAPGLIMAMPGEALRPQTRATGMGVYFAVYYAAMAALMPLAGALRDHTGRPEAPLYFAAALLACAAAALLAFRSLQRRGAAS